MSRILYTILAVTSLVSALSNSHAQTVVVYDFAPQQSLLSLTTNTWSGTYVTNGAIRVDRSTHSFKRSRSESRIPWLWVRSGGGTSPEAGNSTVSEKFEKVLNKIDKLDLRITKLENAKPPQRVDGPVGLAPVPTDYEAILNKIVEQKRTELSDKISSLRNSSPVDNNKIKELEDELRKLNEAIEHERKLKSKAK